LKVLIYIITTTDINTIILDTSYSDVGMKQYTLRASVAVTVPTGISNIDNYMYYGCPMTNVTIPTSVKSIGAGSFSYATSLTKIVIPEGVTSVGTIIISL
jgi:hypothetical protein